MTWKRLLVVAVAVVAALVGGFLALVTKPDRLKKNHAYNLTADEWKKVAKDPFDFIVIGSGSAGCPITNRLSKDHRVLLLEAGGPDTPLEISLPAAFNKLFRTSTDWNFYTVAQKNVLNREMYWPRGKVLGGSSSLNAMIYQRGNKVDYDGWANELKEEEQVNPVTKSPHWSFDDVLHYFKKSERQQSPEMVDKEYHGFNGEWYITENKWVHSLTKDFVKTFSSVFNLPINHDTNGKTQFGVGYNQANLHHGHRHSASDAFLSNDVLARPNLYVRAHAHVTKLLFDEKDATKVTGVEYVDTTTNQTVRVYASKEVILSAGAVQSPQILMLSGIGPKEELEKHGITVRADLPVGHNLQDHITSGMFVNVSRPSLHADDNLKTLFQWLIFSSGPFASNGADLNGFYISPVGQKLGETLPDMQLVGMSAFYVDHGFGKLPYKEGYSLGAVLLQPKSRGIVALKSANPFDAPLIDPKYFEDPEDLQRILASVRLYRQAIHTPPASDFVISEILPGAHAQTDEELKKPVLENSFTLYHPVGTVKMGTEKDTTAVVTPNLKVKGIKGLRVADASIMPKIVRANTNAPTIMIGEKAADLILSDYQ